MPHYRCIVPKDSVSFEQRQEIALAFTDIHCGSTGAPRSFVSVTFIETPPGETSEFGMPWYLDGGNRAGRSEELKQQLLSDLTNAFGKIANVPADMIGGRITENPASWTMEGGFVLPEPGEEGPEWYAAAAASAAD
jgi:phenylpyruvate tautomerase PptA (4-oxalocrotonate tautomerase family)